MRDRCNREIDYIRISVTDRCNLRCVYCMPEEGVPSLTHDQILRFSEIERICRCCADLGIRKFKITGGEPLVRRGIVELIRQIKALPGVEMVTMTTNGVLLREMYDDLEKAGLDAVTISLDTLDPEKYLRITRRDELPRVLEGLWYAVAQGRMQVKVNCVSVRDSRAEELAEVAGLAKNAPVHVRFIEMMPIGLGKQFTFLGEEELIRLLAPYTGELTPYRGRLGNGPAHYYQAEGYQGKLGFISAVSHKFCDSCNRVRLTSEGFLKSCLQYDVGEDLRPALAQASDDVLREAILRGIEKKPPGHSFLNTRELESAEYKGMSQIGG